MEKILKFFKNRRVLLAVVGFGLAMRFAVSSLGYNYDMRSWFIVADITRHGGNVYMETARYNYGPVWFNILHLLDVLAGHNRDLFRYLIAGVLSLVDLGIFCLLYRKAGSVAAALFFLNPVSILITAYHCQFDNMAIFLGLCAVLLLKDDFERTITRRKIYGWLILGLSLMTKHLFFAFPLWLAFKQKGWWQKALTIAVPVACFFAGFAPFWAAGRDGITWHVFHYVPTESNLFYNFFVPPGLQHIWDSESLWYILLMVFGLICRTRGSFDSLLIYTGVLVTFSAATSNQYLAIPVALMAVFPNVFFLIYTIVSTIYLCGDIQGPELLYPPLERFNHYAVYSLFLGMLWMLWRPQFLRLIERFGQEMEFQLGRIK